MNMATRQGFTKGLLSCVPLLLMGFFAPPP